MKRILIFTLILSLFATYTAVHGDSSESIIIEPSKTEMKNIECEKIENEKIIELDLITPRGLKDKRSKLKNRNKVIQNIKIEREKKRGSKDTIPVRVVLHYNTTEEEFINQIKDRLGHNIKYKKHKPKEFDLVVNIDQLSILESMEEVLIIGEQADEKVISIYEEHLNEEISINLNASSEMMGTTKARADFGVTGDLDGNETSYSKNDVVIAIIDTGVDATHVDLDGGKVIGWFDAVNNISTPYDDQGHGTHVASIAAGTGEGDPGIQTGFAPGAALVGVKVLGADGKGTTTDMVEGLQWIYDNLDELSIDVVNISIGTHSPLSYVQEIIDLINDIDEAGVPVFVSAGNEGDGKDGGTFLGTYYNTLSTFAKHTSTSVGSVSDPYEGGWGLSKFSSRGTGSETPYIVSCGENIRAAKANSTNEYVTWSGTSMACPTVTGTFALMYDAAYTSGGGTISFIATDMGEEGKDKNYGGGRLLSYESIKKSGGLSGSFDTYRTYIVDRNGYVGQGSIILYPIQCNSSDAALNTTLLIVDENMENLDIAIWEPGSDPYQGNPSTYYIHEEVDLPQEQFSIPTPKIGLYYIGVYGIEDSANYTLEITGHELEF